MNKDLFKINGGEIAKAFFTIAFACVVVSGVAFAQTTFIDPTTAAPGGNIAPPVNAGPVYQEKTGGITAASVGSTNGYSVPGTYSPSTWKVDFSRTVLTQTQYTTFGTQQICLGASCVTSLGPLVPSADIYLNGSSCNGGYCNADMSTATQICANNGYSQVVSAIGGSVLQRVTCDDINYTSL